MNRVIALLGGGVLAAGLSLGVFAKDDGHKDHEHEEGEMTSVKGELIDTACFVTSDGDAKGEEHAACATKCMATGIPAGILPEGKAPEAMMFLLTNPKPFARYAGQTIHVEGTAHPKMHAMDVKKAHVVMANGKMKEIKLDDEHHKMGGDDAAEGDGKHKDDHEHDTGKAKGAGKSGAKKK